MYQRKNEYEEGGWESFQVKLCTFYLSFEEMCLIYLGTLGSQIVNILYFGLYPKNA